MFVTNIRYGELPVRKVYLGEKLIWQCIDVQGDAQSSSSMSAHFYVTNIDSVFSKSISMSHDDAKLNKPEIILSISNVEHTSYTDATLNLFKILLLSSNKSNSKINTNTFGEILNAEPMYGISDTKSETLIKFRLIVSKDMESKTNINYNVQNTLAAALIPQFTGGNSISNSYATASASDGVCIVDLNSYMRSQSNGDSVLFCLMPLDMTSSAESNSHDDSIVCAFDAVLIRGSSSTDECAQAICDLCNLCLINGKSESSSNAGAFINFYDAVVSKGHSKSKTYAYNFIGKYFVIVSNSNINSDSYGSASAILWYPPIGDGVPLVENDGVDITIDGNILEIQQAYQINIDDENGILEVI